MTLFQQSVAPKAHCSKNRHSTYLIKLFVLIQTMFLFEPKPRFVLEFNQVVLVPEPHQLVAPTLFFHTHQYTKSCEGQNISGHLELSILELL